MQYAKLVLLLNFDWTIQSDLWGGDQPSVGERLA